MNQNNIDTLIETYGIEAHVSKGAPIDYQLRFPMCHYYTITLRRTGTDDTLTVPFHMSIGDHRIPTAQMVLPVVLDEASSVEWDSYPSWCDELGYDPYDSDDNELHMDEYVSCERLLKDVQAFLGETYDEFVYKD